MEIHHKLKPPHGWREFLFEIGTIVLGVLIALGGEQTVEAMHRAHEVHEAEDAMRLELVGDDGPQSYVRAAASPCLTGQLVAVRAALVAGADRKVFHDMAAAYKPPIRIWDDQAWKMVAASGVATSVGAGRLMDWSAAYVSMPTMQLVSADEVHDIDALTTGRTSPGKLSDDETDRSLFVVDRLIRENKTLGLLSLSVLSGMEKVGAPLSLATRRDLLAETRRRYGSCVTEPDLNIWRRSGQISSAK